MTADARALKLVNNSYQRPGPAPTGALGSATSPAVFRQDYLGASMQSQVLSTTLRYTVRPVIKAWAKWPHLPWPTGIVDLAGSVLPPIAGTQYRPVQLDKCGAEWVRAAEVEKKRVVLYLHGGAFLCCGLRTHRRMVSQVSAAAQAPVLTVDYRMMPRYTINDAVEDGVTAYRWLLRRGYRPDQIVIAGDSAGGYLSFMVPLALRSQGIPGPAGIVAMSPLTNLNPSHKIAHENANKCPLFPADVFQVLSDFTDSVETRLMINGRPGPRVCPVDADLSGMPPTLIQVGSTEILLPDSEMMAERLALHGAPVNLQVWDRQVHVFQAASGLVPESQRAIGEVGGFVQRVVPVLQRATA